jgi:hypothetical protein
MTDLIGAPALSRSSDPGTSHEAAASLDTTRLRQIVLGTLETVYPDGLTSQEIGDRAGIGRDTISPRMKPLEKMELVERNGTRVPQGGNKKQIIWCLRK